MKPLLTHSEVFNIMSKKGLILLGLVLMLGSSFAEIDTNNLDRDCVYRAGSFTLHCSNAKPGKQIAPGTKDYIEVRCCFTSDYYLSHEDEEVEISIVAKASSTSRVQHPNLSWEQRNTTYVATQYISKIEAPATSTGFKAFPVKIWFDLPYESPDFTPGESIQARIEISAVIPGGFVPVSGVYPQIWIPETWKKSNPLMFFTGVIILVFVAVVFALLLIKRKI